MAMGQASEVTIGAEVWNYNRVYPLLDGLFQDAASTQVQQLTLDPNKANGSQLDALIQSFQVQAGFSQLAGAQNAAAAQMSVANAQYQSALAQEQQSLMVQSVAAQQALTKASQDLNNATAGGDPTQIATANLEVQNAQALVNGLAAEQKAAQGPTTPFTPAAATGTIAATPSTFTSGVPAAVLSNGSLSGGPSFPATKQLDNQMDLLWSRISRVVGVMAGPDSIPSATTKMFLLKFDTSTFPHKNRKERILETRYNLTCMGNVGGIPTVVDVFPSVAAVNVANTKYRDNADIFGVLLSFLSFGFNASYNREHLKMSQTLGQASYITGYGVDQSTFGWRFGIPIGDNFVSSDTKITFALIAAPANCKPVVAAPPATIAWERRDGTEATAVAAPVISLGRANATMAAEVAADPPPPALAAGSPAPDVVKSISFNRASYNPATYTPANPVLVAVSVTLRRPIDQQATLTANGILLRRARDTFGRAIPTGAGSGGLLEESTGIAQANTWIPISPTNLLITLDAGQFGSVFPTIKVNNPDPVPASVITASFPPGRSVVVNGQPFQCLTVGGNCQLPSLGYQTPASTKVSVLLWEAGCISSVSPPDCTGYLVLQSLPASISGNSSSGASAQAVSGTSLSPWGVNPEVSLQVPALNNNVYKMNCSTGDSFGVTDPVTAKPDYIRAEGNLICQFWDGDTLDEFASLQQTGYQLQVIDQGHTGGPLLGTAILPPGEWGSDSPGMPRLWAASSPQWYDSNGDHGSGHWEFHVTFANVVEGSSIGLSPDPVNGGKAISATSCDQVARMCTWNFSIAAADFYKWYDRIRLTLANDPGDEWQLLNIRTQISPLVSAISPDYSTWSGLNFTSVFSSSAGPKTGLLVNKTLFPINCVVTSCTVSDASSTAGASNLAKTPGLMILQTDFGQFPLMQLSAGGTPQQISIPQPPKNAAGGNPSPGPNPTGGANQNGQQTGAQSNTLSNQVPITIVVGGSK